MYREYWHLNDLPFENIPNYKYYYYTKNHKIGFGYLLFSIETNKGGAVLTGGAGSGKTALCQALIEKINTKKYDIAMIQNPIFSSNHPLKEIVHALGIECHYDSKIELIHHLTDHLYANCHSSKKTIIIIDEAHLIKDRNIFEELRLLLNFQLNDSFLLHLILIGQPALMDLLSHNKALKQRFFVKFHLKPLEYEEIANYIFFRLKTAGAQSNPFAIETYEMIYKSSQGIPRIINTICAYSLLYAYRHNLSKINPEIISNICISLGYKNEPQEKEINL